MSVSGCLYKWGNPLIVVGRGLVKVDYPRPKSAPSSSRSIHITEQAVPVSSDALSSVSIHGQPILRRNDVIDQAIEANDPISSNNDDNAELSNGNTQVEQTTENTLNKHENIDAATKDDNVDDVAKDSKCIGVSEDDITNTETHTGSILLDTHVRDINVDTSHAQLVDDNNTSKLKKGKVRFADEVTGAGAAECQTDVTFFLTEDRKPDTAREEPQNTEEGVEKITEKGLCSPAVDDTSSSDADVSSTTTKLEMAKDDEALDKQDIITENGKIDENINPDTVIDNTANVIPEAQYSPTDSKTISEVEMNSNEDEVKQSDQDADSEIPDPTSHVLHKANSYTPAT